MTTPTLPGLAGFIEASPSPWHAAATLAETLSTCGFTRVEADEPWPDAPGGYVLVRDGAVVAWRRPTRPARDFRIVGVHTDSPTFRLKPHPQSAHPSGWNLLNVEPYGGLIPNSWLDRDLAIAGRLVSRDGRVALARTGPLARIPQLAIHLDRSQRDQLSLDRQAHLRPLWALGDDADVIAHVASIAGLAASEVAAFDLVLADTQPPARLGAEGNLLAAPRQDNLVSVWSALTALAGVEEPGHVSVLAAFTHEEIGSGSASGARGPLLEDVLERIAESIEPGRSAFRRMLARSVCVSSDVAHGVHPNYADRHDPAHAPMLGGGPVVKINANVAYATDAPGQALWQQWSETAGVPCQLFVSNNAVPCGSTIGPLTATRLGLRVIDVGAPILSMHSVRELSHVRDHDQMAAVMRAFYEEDD